MSFIPTEISMFRGYTRSLSTLAVAAALLLPAMTRAQASPTSSSGAGILVMAHGGQPEWDQAVVDAIVPLKQKIPITLALGMADPVTLQAGLDSLAARGVETVAVVRLFLSGESFLHDTEFYLGLREDAPEVTMAMMMMSHGGHGSHGAAAAGGAHGSPGQTAAHEMPPPAPLRRSAEILLEPRGLSEAPLTAAIIADRAHSVSLDPAEESVIVIAHGMGEEGENQRVLDNMQPALAALRERGFHSVHAATLREDWPEARVRAEAQIREWVGSRQSEGDRVIVVPYRLFGFGDYAQVLEGLTFTPADGLLPHPLITDWIAGSASSLFCARGIANPLSACGGG